MYHYDDLRTKLGQIIDKHGIINKTVSVISIRKLTPDEAIGAPERKDFPLLKGKEFMVEACFQGDKGHAYTDMPKDFTGTLKDVLTLPCVESDQRAIFISVLNALMRRYGYVSNTVHCRDKEPEICASKLPDYVKRFHNSPKIAFVGFQPAMIHSLSSHFPMRVLDMDPDNIGRIKYDCLIEPPEKTDEVLSWSDIILATGSTSVNGTIKRFMNKKPVIFYGVSIAGIAKLYGYKRFCPFAH